MLFNSLTFVLFALIFFLLWPWLRKQNTSRWLTLTLASFLFYAWWDWRALPLLMMVGFADYLGALAIDKFPKRKRLFLGLSLTINLGVLCLFKYLGFLTENINSIAGFLGGQDPLDPVAFVLPLGISFYTFESLSYVIDVYRGELKPARNVLHYFAFLSLFPHLIAGPIIRPSDLLPQLQTTRSPSPAEQWEGLQLIAFGYFKKTVIADNLAPAVNTAFANPHLEASMPYWWLVVSMFAFQIFCDFSGYSDIARGLARWLGYDFPLNFNHPYLAKGFRDFWRRWHISLSTWFRDYVYIPLGGSKGGLYAGILAMSITMVVSGFWHGAAWTFVFWGFLHAVYLAIERLTDWPKKLSGIAPWGTHLVSVLVVVQVWVAWVFFRATSFGQAGAIVREMFNVTHWHLSVDSVLKEALPFLAVAIGIELFFYFGLHQWVLPQALPAKEDDAPSLSSGWSIPRWKLSLQATGVMLLLLGAVFLRGPGGTFIYFQF